MKVLVCLILILSFCLSVMAQDYPISVTMTGPTFYNMLRISSFDLQVPANQPLFFQVTAFNNAQEGIENPHLYFSLMMNTNTLIEPNTRVTYKHTINPGSQLIFTNRDIITEVGSLMFNRPVPNFSALDVIDNMPDFRDIILNTGLFPDGNYTYTIQFRDDNNQPLSEEASLTFIIRNPGGIFLINPGVALGGAIPAISSMPVNFIWSSNLAATSYNPFRLIVKEFDDPSLLYPEYIEAEGHTIANVEISSSTYFSDYIPLQEDKFYAWKIETPLIDPTVSEPGKISSTYNVFKYTIDQNYNNEVLVNALRVYLLSLNIPWVTELLNSGYDPSGIINYNGSVWSGSGAENMIQELRSRPVIDVNLVE